MVSMSVLCEERVSFSSGPAATLLLLELLCELWAMCLAEFGKENFESRKKDLGQTRKEVSQQFLESMDAFV